MTVSADNPRGVIRDAGGEERVITEKFKDENGELDLRGKKVNVLAGQTYTDDKGIEREFVQTEQGAFLAVPKRSISRGKSVSMSMPMRVWNRIFGKKKG